MRNFVLAFHGAVILFFIVFLTYSFVARNHLNSLAKDFLIGKTVEYSKPVVDIAEEALNSKWIKRLLPKKQSQTIRDEIESYRIDPSKYVADLTEKGGQAIEKKQANPLLEKVTAVKTKIRNYYFETLDKLIQDLRLFSITNLVASLIGFGMAYFKKEEASRSMVGFSLMMLGSIVYCSYLYVDNLSFFRILFQLHIGWGYPIILVSVLLVSHLYTRFQSEVDTLVSQPMTPQRFREVLAATLCEPPSTISPFEPTRENYLALLQESKEEEKALRAMFAAGLLTFGELSAVETIMEYDPEKKPGVATGFLIAAPSFALSLVLPLPDELKTGPRTVIDRRKFQQWFARHKSQLAFDESSSRFEIQVKKENG